MAQSIISKIEELSEERERLLAREGNHQTGSSEQADLQRIDHDLKVLWDLRRRELSGEEVDLQEDYYDRYDRYTGREGPGA